MPAPSAHFQLSDLMALDWDGIFGDAGTLAGRGLHALLLQNL